MPSWLKGVLLTAATWAALIVVYLGVDSLTGERPFAAFETWGPSARFITFSVAGVMVLGALIGISSDKVRARVQQGRR